MNISLCVTFMQLSLLSFLSLVHSGTVVYAEKIDFSQEEEEAKKEKTEENCTENPHTVTRSGFCIQWLWNGMKRNGMEWNEERERFLGVSVGKILDS